MWIADETTIKEGGMAWPTLRQVVKVRDTAEQDIPVTDIPKLTALVMRTMVPIPSRTLKKVHSLAKEIHNPSSSNYELVLLVDMTQAKNESEVNRTVETYWRDLDPTLPLPYIFPVSESIILKEFPKLTNYIHNGPDEANTNNEAGLCCRKNIMWQMLFPSLATFMMHNAHRYQYAWIVGDDVGMFAKGNLTFLQLIKKWDASIGAQVVHLVAEPTNLHDIPNQEWIHDRHTHGFDVIIKRMENSSTTNWTCYVDQVQRHSLFFAKVLHKNFANNTFQFGECLVQPIAWNSGLSIVHLSSLNASVGRLHNLARKIHPGTALDYFVTSYADTYDSILFHESFGLFDR